MISANSAADNESLDGSVKISVIVPIYNVEKHVGPCIESILAQTQTDFEVIAVDDGSSDNSANKARAAAGDDARFRFVRRDNGGLSAARNTGLELARGEYVCFVDSDDRVAPTYLARLCATLEATGSPWVACGVMFCHADGREVAHPAIHGIPEPDWQEAGPVRHDFSDWQEIVRHYPSAWNKIYRRALIGTMRFDEGLYYEDHPFYYRYAKATDHMVHLPEPLYLHTLGREGQITRDGSDRVFEQFPVLEVMREVMQGQGLGPGSGKSGAGAAFAQIATRLTYERIEAISDRARRGQFLARARTVVGGDSPVEPSDRLGVPAWWIDLLQGRVPLSVVVPSDGNPGPLRDTLASLARQTVQEGEVLVVLDDGGANTSACRTDVFAAVAEFAGVSLLTGSGEPGVSGARNRGLDAARGRAVVFLDAGDTLAPGTLGHWHNRLVRAGGDLGFARFVMGTGGGAGGGKVHSGLHERAALADGFAATGGFAPARRDGVFIHAHPSAKIFDRAFLLRHGLRFAPEPLASWGFLLAAMGCADHALYLDAAPPVRIANRAETRRLWRAPVPMQDLARALERLRCDTGTQPLEPALFTRLFVRAVWEKINFAEFPDDPSGARARATFEVAARGFADTLVEPHAPLDSFVASRLRRILGLSIN